MSDDDAALFGGSDDDNEAGLGLTGNGAGSSQDGPVQTGASLSNPMDEDDDAFLFGADDDEAKEKTEEEKLAEILGTEKVDAKAAVRAEIKKTKSKMYLEKTPSLPDANSLFYLHLPSTMRIQQSEYDSSLYDAEQEKRDIMTGDDKVADIIRWRYKKDAEGNIMKDNSTGEPVKESNARLQKLKNGTYRVIIGKSVYNTTLEDIKKQYVFFNNKSVAPENAAIDELLTQEQIDSKMTVSDETSLTCAASLDGAKKMTLQPTKETHNRIQTLIRSKYTKTDRMGRKDLREIKVRPELAVEKEVRDEEARLREAKRAKDADRPRYGRIQMSSDYLNADEDADAQYDDINLGDIKKGRNKRKATGNRYNDYSDSEDEEADDGDDGEMNDFIVKGGDDGEDEDDDDEADYQPKTKVSKKTDDDDEEDEGDLFSDDEEEIVKKKSASKPASDTMDVDEEGGGGAGIKVRKGVIEDSDDE